MSMGILNILLLLSGNLFITHCIEDVFYNHPTLPIQCAKCDRGEKVKNYCSTDKQNSECVECEKGTFADVLSKSKFCENCVECINGQIIKENCTSIKNTKCQCPDKKYYHLKFCRDCIPPKIKIVRDNIEYCEDCKAGSYYNDTSQKCYMCDTCTKYQQTVHSCNITHNTQCRYISSVTSPSTTEVPEKYDAGLSAVQIAGIIIGIILVLVILCVVFCFRRKKLFCFKKKNNRKINGKAPIASYSQDPESRETSSSTPCIPNSGSCETNTPLISANPTATGDQEKRSSMPHWLSIISKILSDNLGDIDRFISHLGTDKFNARAKFQQLKEFDLEVRLSKFLDKWYEQNPWDANPRQVISALECMDKNDIVKIIKDNVVLKEQLFKENRIDAEEEPNIQFPVDKEKKKYPTQVTSDSMLANLLIPNPDVLSMSDMRASMSHNQDQENQAPSSSTPWEREKRSSMPYWLNITSKILAENLDNLAETEFFILHLRTDKFNAPAEFVQLKEFDMEVRLSKFLDKWYEQNLRDANLRRVIAALEYKQKDYIVKIIKCNVELKEQLIKENIIDADFEEPNIPSPANEEKKRKYPRHATNDNDSVNHSLLKSDMDSMDNRGMPDSEQDLDPQSESDQTKVKILSWSDPDEEQTSLKQLISLEA